MDIGEACRTLLIEHQEFSCCGIERGENGQVENPLAPIRPSGEQLGGNPYSPKKDSVDYAWAGHYLVYGWISSQCIIKVFTLRQFQDRCQARNILKGYSPNQRYAVPKD